MTPLPLAAVVIVDDEIDHAIIMGRVLAEVAPGVEVLVMTDPANIEARLRDVPIGALVLIDRKLGRDDSIAMIAPLLAARADLGVVLLSSALIPADHERALAAGAIVAAEKPGSLAGWRALLRELLALHSARPAA